MTPWIQTRSGIKFPIKPRIRDINILDIATALSREPRFSGMLKFNYSVGQHSCYVHDLLEVHGLEGYGLLHDGSEAYLRDVPSPFKKTRGFSAYRRMEKRCQTAIYRAFGLAKLRDSDAKRVHLADMRVLLTEAIWGFDKLADGWLETFDTVSPAPINIVVWEEKRTYNEFMRRFDAYRERQNSDVG